MEITKVIKSKRILQAIMVILGLFDILTNFLFTTSEKRSMIISNEHGIKQVAS